LYGLGVLLYYVLSGRHPVEGADYAQLLAAHEAGGRVALRERRPDLSAPFVEAIERALRSDPTERWSSAAEMDRALSVTKAPAGRRLTGRKLATLLRPSWLSWRRAAWALSLPFIVLLAVWLANFGRYRVEGGLYRALPQGGQASLTAADAIAPEERIFLEFKASKDLYVYVIERDDAGTLELVARDPLGAGPRPLARNIRHRLPGAAAGLLSYREDANRAGRILFLVIASPEPLAHLEERLAEREGPGPVLLAEDELIRALDAAASPRQAVHAGAAERIMAQAKALGPEPETIRGAWIRKLEVGLRPR
jgi:hypothetical protein